MASPMTPRMPRAVPKSPGQRPRLTVDLSARTRVAPSPNTPRRQAPSLTPGDLPPTVDEDHESGLPLAAARSPLQQRRRSTAREEATLQEPSNPFRERAYTDSFFRDDEQMQEVGGDEVDFAAFDRELRQVEQNLKQGSVGKSKHKKEGKAAAKEDEAGAAAGPRPASMGSATPGPVRKSTGSSAFTDVRPGRPVSDHSLSAEAAANGLPVPEDQLAQQAGFGSMSTSEDGSAATCVEDDEEGEDEDEFDLLSNAVLNAINQDSVRKNRRRSSLFTPSLNLGHDFTESSLKQSPWKVGSEDAEQPFNRRETRKVKRDELKDRLCAKCEAGANTYLMAARNKHPHCLHVLKMKDKHRAKDRPKADVRDPMGATPLHYAARVGNLDMVQWLIENQISVRVEARNGASPVHDAAASGSLDCLKCLLFHDPGAAQFTINYSELLPIHLAAMFGRSEVLAWLVEKKHNSLVAQTSAGLTPLHYAAMNGHVEATAYLATAMPKNSLDVRDNDGGTPLFRAAEANEANIVEMLLDGNADANAVCGGLQPVHIAARVDSFETVELLINRDPRLFFALTDDGNSPMHLAAMHGAESTLRWLLEERKRRPTSEVAAAWIDRNGDTPVHLAAEVGNMAALQVLVDSKVRLDSKNHAGKTPQDLAREAGFTECAIYLTLKSG